MSPPAAGGSGLLGVPLEWEFLEASTGRRVMGSFCGVKPLSVPGPLSLRPPGKESSCVSPTLLRVCSVHPAPGWLGCVPSGRPLCVASAWRGQGSRSQGRGTRGRKPLCLGGCVPTFPWAYLAPPSGQLPLFQARWTGHTFPMSPQRHCACTHLPPCPGPPPSDLQGADGGSWESEGTASR